MPLLPLHGKYNEELALWREWFKAGGERLTDAETIAGYERIMLAIAEEPTADFLAGKIVADFGCGPRGSLVWARNAPPSHRHRRARRSPRRRVPEHNSGRTE